MKKLFLLWGILFFVSVVCAQEEGFVSLYIDPDGKSWSPFDVIETNSGNYWFSASNYHGTESRIFCISSDGAVFAGPVIEEEGMYVYVTKMISLSDGSGDILALAVCRQVVNGPSCLMALRLDTAMNVVQRCVVPFPFGEKPVKDIKILDKSDDIFAAVTIGQQPPFEIFLAEISKDGEIDKYTKCDMDSLVTVCNLFPMQGEANHFGMFAQTSGNSNASMGILVFDGDLELVRRHYFPQWDCGENLMYLNDYGNSMVMPLPDTGYLISSRVIEFSAMQFDQSSLFAKTGNDFTMHNYTVIGHLNDTVEYPAFYKSADCIAHAGNTTVYQCTMQNIIQGWPLQFAPLHLVVTKADANLNVKWQKRFLTDGNAYTPFTMLATSDGGCLVIGEVFDFKQNQRWGLFALKIIPYGTVGIDEIQEGSPAFVYPNPAKKTIGIGGVEAKETQVFNTLGQCVMSFRGNEASVEALASGVYLLKTTDTEEKKQTLRIVVTK